MATIRAATSQGLLAKADRLFRNDDAGVFVELLQNSRRAGASKIAVSITPLPGEKPVSQIVFQDDGRGVEDFQKLLTLGDSGWTSGVRDTEDPAGMGFFSLCHSDVEVTSADRRVLLCKEVFLGAAEAEIEIASEPLAGTRIMFTRPSAVEPLHKALSGVAEFYPLPVFLNGQELPRHDFLEGALYREEIDGVEVGFATRYLWGHGYCHANWNFHGLCLREPFDDMTGFLSFEQSGWTVSSIEARFNVLEVGRVKLQLPDRRAIVQDDGFKELHRKVRAAAYRFFQTQQQHVLPFKFWKEAQEMGIALPEASPLLDSWHAAPLDADREPVFGRTTAVMLPTMEGAVLVDHGLGASHTLEAALGTSPLASHQFFFQKSGFAGYEWYDALPRLSTADVLVDRLPYDEWREKSLPRPETMELATTIEHTGRSNVVHRFPIQIHVVEDDMESYGEAEFVAVRNSRWDNDGLDGPFNVVEFLMAATFLHSDSLESDSWETQAREHREYIERMVNDYFRGPKAALLALLRDAFAWDIRHYAAELDIQEIRFRKPSDGTSCWDVELQGPES